MICQFLTQLSVFASAAICVSVCHVIPFHFRFHVRLKFYDIRVGPTINKSTLYGTDQNVLFHCIEEMQLCYSYDLSTCSTSVHFCIHFWCQFCFHSPHHSILFPSPSCFHLHLWPTLYGISIGQTMDKIMLY